MSRSGDILNKQGKVVGWVVYCDTCFLRKLGPRRRQEDFPLIELYDQYWSVNKYGDRCPECVRHLGRLDGEWTRNKLYRDFLSDRRQCLHYYGREPQSPAVERYVGWA